MTYKIGERLTTDNTELVRRAKIGTITPKTIWVHEDDMPLEVDKHFRYLTSEPTEFGFYPEYGKVYEIRDTTYFVNVDGMPWEVEALDY